MPGSGEHYIPRPDADFAAWANQYYDAVEKFYITQGLDPAELAALKDALAAWNLSYPAHIRAQAAAEGARAAKATARQILEQQIRPVTNFVQGFPRTTNTDRATMGISVRDPSRTRALPPASRPLALVDSGQRLTHQLRLVDESTPTRRAKPRGVLGAEIWVKLIPANEPTPTDPSVLSFLTLTTRPTCRTDFPADSGGKTAVYMTRWVNTRGEKGPWSEVTTATVAA